MNRREFARALLTSVGGILVAGRLSPGLAAKPTTVTLQISGMS